jgi:hypothetical protein
MGTASVKAQGKPYFSASLVIFSIVASISLAAFAAPPMA